jgi:pilus assembly protein FimV
MADETEIKHEIDDLSPAFDSIDADMKVRRRRREVTITPEKLTQIVNHAVARALAAYEEERVARLERAKPPAPPSRWKAKIERLKGDMGLEEIAFDQPRPAPADMGISDFTFDDSPAAAPAGAPAAIAAPAPVPAADPTPVPARAPEPIAAADAEAIRKQALGEATKVLFAPMAGEPKNKPEG